ncbi:hypothetical protein PAPYR_5054 [Paratrimastix pyriformis]|uniref:Smr domain-containing protein n=1 Tax=Paratrimastix pyriformis TaxID=342808 RepID=A0ABQ8UND1_9EUKA|nr:hypothetical protein PAPYR_5054 [Paratrimastix pyriformis]
MPLAAFQGSVRSPSAWAAPESESLRVRLKLDKLKSFTYLMLDRGPPPSPEQLEEIFRGCQGDLSASVRAARDVYGQPAAPQEELEAIPKDMGRTVTVPPPRPRSRSRSPSGSPQPAAHIPLSMREALRAATGGTDVPIYNADDTNGLYRSARESCAALQQAIAHCAESATRAYLNHDGKAAHEYSRKARELRAKLRPEQERAFNTIFTARNEHLRDSYAIDLHGLHVNEALGVLEAHFQLMRDAPEHPPRVILITGRGSHSRGHARLVPAVEAFLQGQRAHYSFNPDGFFISLFHLKRGVLQSILQSVDVERNPLFIAPPVATAFSPNSTAQCSTSRPEEPVTEL